jgi:hypothetical protein
MLLAELCDRRPVTYKQIWNAENKNFDSLIGLSWKVGPINWLMGQSFRLTLLYDMFKDQKFSVV